MLESTFQDIKVSGIVAAVPKQREVIIEKYGKIFGEDAVASFSKMTGVRERRIAQENQTASDLSFVAARELIEKKNINTDEIGILVFVTETPDYRIPSTACVLHSRLGLQKDCLAFDVNLGCSGYVYGIQIVSSLLASIGCKYGMLLAGDTVNKMIAPEDKSTAMLFGDAGSATLLETHPGEKQISTAFRTDGSGFKALIVPAGCYRNTKAKQERSLWADGNQRSDYDLYMNGTEIFSFSTSEVPVLINEFFDKENEAIEDYDSFVFHQANDFILKRLIKKCKLPKEKVPISIDRYGNTPVTAIPLTICDKYGKDKENRELHLFTCGFGVGLSWGIAAFTINQEDIFPMIETDEYYKEGAVSHDD